MHNSDDLVQSLSEMQSILITSETNTIKRLTNLQRSYDANRNRFEELDSILSSISQYLHSGIVDIRDLCDQIRACQSQVTQLRDSVESFHLDTVSNLSNMFNEHALSIRASSDVICRVLTGEPLDGVLEKKKSSSQ